MKYDHFDLTVIYKRQLNNTQFTGTSFAILLNYRYILKILRICKSFMLCFHGTHTYQIKLTMSNMPHQEMTSYTR